MEQDRLGLGGSPRGLTGAARRLAHAALAGCLVLLAAGCGSEEPAESTNTVTPEDVAACLADAGFEVTIEAAMDDTQRLGDELKVMLGLVEVMIFDRSDGFGLGTVQFFKDDKAASEGQDSVASVRTAEVKIGRVGDAVYDYIGDEPERALVTIEGCLGA